MSNLAMKMVLAGGFVACAMAILATSNGNAANAVADIKESVQGVADAFAANDTDAIAKKSLAASRQYQVEELMHLFSSRKTAKAKGFGIGAQPGIITPDGIEAKLTNMGKKALSKATLEKEAGPLTEMAYRTAAISDIAVHKAPVKDMGDKKRKDWITWSENCRASALDLASALKGGDAAKAKAAAAKVTQACNTCHGTFRD